MAIFRQRLPIPGPFDIRIGLPRDKGFDPRKARKRFLVAYDLREDIFSNKSKKTFRETSVVL